MYPKFTLYFFKKSTFWKIWNKFFLQLPNSFFCSKIVPRSRNSFFYFCSLEQFFNRNVTKRVHRCWVLGCAVVGWAKCVGILLSIIIGLCLFHHLHNHSGIIEIVETLTESQLGLSQILRKKGLVVRLSKKNGALITFWGEILLIWCINCMLPSYPIL